MHPSIQINSTQQAIHAVSEEGVHPPIQRSLSVSALKTCLSIISGLGSMFLFGMAITFDAAPLLIPALFFAICALSLTPGSTKVYASSPGPIFIDPRPTIPVVSRPRATYWGGDWLVGPSRPVSSPSRPVVRPSRSEARRQPLGSRVSLGSR